MIVPCEIIDKRIKDGIFSTKYIATVCPTSRLKRTYIDIKLTKASYYETKVGDTINVPFYEEDDGLWYTEYQV